MNPDKLIWEKSYTISCLSSTRRSVWRKMRSRTRCLSRSWSIEDALRLSSSRHSKMADFTGPDGYRSTLLSSPTSLTHQAHVIHGIETVPSRRRFWPGMWRLWGPWWKEWVPMWLHVAPWKGWGRPMYGSSHLWWQLCACASWMWYGNCCG